MLEIYYFIDMQSNVIGIIGVVLTLAAYLLLQMNKLSSATLTYSLLNAVGSFLILISLFFYWNCASFIIEASWLLISLYGLLRIAIKSTVPINQGKTTL